MNEIDLSRFTEAQEKHYNTALREIKNGRKRTHWMWFIFPQISGLGYSETAKFYAIRDKAEAEAYLNHPLLGPRLVEICRALLDLEEDNAGMIFGSPDDMKLKSSMTLFDACASNPVFERVLEKYFKGSHDHVTLRQLL